MIDAPLELYQDHVRPEWVDYNGHLNDGYYAVAFGVATEKFLELVGLHAAYRAETGCTIYTAEAHITYLREMSGAAPLRVSCQLLGFDAKRIHLYQEMHHAQENYLAAVYEGMFLHVDQRILKTAPLPEAALKHLGEIAEAHGGLGTPTRAGRGISLQR